MNLTQWNAGSSKGLSIGRRRHRGFTLIELMVVILILAILASLIVPKVVGRTSQAKVSAAKTDISQLASLISGFRIDCDRYPSTEEGLNSLRVCPSGLEGKWRGPYTTKDIPVDPWGNTYQYSYPGSTGPESFILISYGADGQPGGDGDNADISEEG